MPADIEQFEGKAAFVSARELPWHRLGTVTEGAMTADEALELAHMKDWNVRKTPLFTTVAGTDIEVPDKFAVVRDNPFEPKVDVLGTVGKHYVPTQNEEHADFLNTLVDASGAHFETAGSLDDGRRTFVTMRMPETLFVGGVDPVDTYIAAANSHDGSTSFQVLTTPVRVVCANTLAAALHGASRIAKVRHTAGQGGAIARVRQTLDITFKYMGDFEAEIERMVQEDLTNREFERIVGDLFPVKDSASDLLKRRAATHRENIMALFEASATLTDVRGTNWAGYNAVTEYLDHFVELPGKASQDELLDARASRVMNGDMDALKDRAFKLLAV